MKPKNPISKGQIPQRFELPRVPRKSTVLNTSPTRIIIPKSNGSSVPLKGQMSSCKVARRLDDRAGIIQKLKRVLFKLRHCKLFKITCYLSETFFDHLNGRKHQTKKANKEYPSYCPGCKRGFDSQDHLKRHTQSKYHISTSSNRN